MDRSSAREFNELTRMNFARHRLEGADATTASQRSLHNAPIFRLLLKVAVNGTHQCDFLNFCGGFGSQLFMYTHGAIVPDDMNAAMGWVMEAFSKMSPMSFIGGAGRSMQAMASANACWKKLASLLPLEKFCYG